MPAPFTSEQVLALAPDPASAKSGRGLASLGQWKTLGYSESAVWGECQGSGKDPYRTQVDLSEPAFRCSCPSRKFPCKHSLGLLLLLTEQSSAFAATEPPAWVAEWLISRAKRAEKAAQPKSQEADPTAQAKRAAARQRKVEAGAQELRRWLEDRIRQGLATLQQASCQPWEAMAARLVDAQAPGLAQRLRDLGGLAHSGTGWNERLLAGMGQLYLIAQAVERLDSLPATVQADLRTQIGWTLNQETVLAEPAHTDLWLVVGQRQEVQDRLKIRRTWLWGIHSATFALLLEFAHGQQPFEQNYLPGTCLPAELVFYPSAYPLRALIKSREAAVSLAKAPPGYAEISEAISNYSRALSVCPWLAQFPLLLQVVPFHEGERWWAQDSHGYVLPLASRLGLQKWQLLSLSGGYPCTLFGEWNGTELLPLGVWAEDCFYGLG